MISYLRDILPKYKDQNLLKPFRSIPRRLVISKFVVQFGIGLASSLVLSLAFNSNVVATPESGHVLSPLISQVNQANPPKNSSIRLLETVGLFVGGIVFCIALDRWFSDRSAQLGNTPLAQQARRLKQLKIGYPEGMTNFEVLRSQALLEERLRPFGLIVTWTSFLSASALIEALSNGTIEFLPGGVVRPVFSPRRRIMSLCGWPKKNILLPKVKRF